MNVGQYSTAMEILRILRPNFISSINTIFALSYQPGKKDINHYPDWVKDWKRAYNSLGDEIRKVKQTTFGDREQALFEGGYVKWQGTKNAILHYLRLVAKTMLEIRHEMRKWNKREGFRK